MSSRPETRYILLVEDEPLILMDLEFAAEDRDCTPLSATSVRQAMDLLNGDYEIDAAVLDVTLKGDETCVPIARELEKRGIPYLLHSGDLDRRDETVRKLDAMLIAKPASADKVICAAIQLTQGGGQAQAMPAA